MILSVLRIHDILVWIRMRILILLFSSLTFKTQKKKMFQQNFFCILLFEATFPPFFKDKKSKRGHKTVEIKVFLTIFAE
jgi:hypothetical protein